MKREMFNMRKVIIGATIALITTSLMAQPGQGNGKLKNGDQPCMQMHEQIPNLTPEQEKNIGELRAARMKEMNNFRSDMMIKNAELQKLQTEDNPDLGKINAKIDEIGKIRTDIAKKKAAHLQKVRSLLNEEQRIYFDAGKGKMGSGMNRGRQGDQGFHQGTCGNCPRRNL